MGVGAAVWHLLKIGRVICVLVTCLQGGNHDVVTVAGNCVAIGKFLVPCVFPVVFL